MDAWKMIYLARRNPALRAEDFPQAWREHSALGRQCANVRDKVLAVTQCSRVLDPPAPLPGTSPDYDGVNLLALRDRQAADDIWNDPETLAIMRPDEPRVFSTYVRDFTLIARESVIVDGPRSDVCVAFFLRTRDGPAPAAAPIGGPDMTPWLRARRVVANVVDGARPAGYEFDLIVEAWYESVERALMGFAGRPVWDRLPNSLSSRVDVGRSVCLLTHVTHRRP
ncbi:EthD domain-containing protein [Aromatoleum evansii]|uniref:EthD domain-containing protein n=1 Tax=Aromatoleum evansii TaxID=59406 RepID=UPI00145FCA57|nr:EthD domain-containing protein [Aromatoleum evansii]NMG31570.1 hypothetical protein [Aromatoleum evansii]